MARRRLIVFVLLVGALLAAWAAYGSWPALVSTLPRHLRGLAPLYAESRPTDLHDPGVQTRLAAAVATGIGSVVALVCLLARRAPTVVCLLVAVAGVLATNVSVARIRAGEASFVAPFKRTGLEYFTDVPLVGDSPRQFIRRYPELAQLKPRRPDSQMSSLRRFLTRQPPPPPRLSHHAATHPPGGVLFLWAGTRLFGPTVNAAAWWAVAFTALGVLPAHWLASTMGGAAAARRMLPLYAAAPNLVLFGATCMDGVFLVFAVTALAASVFALHRRTLAWSAFAGVLLWTATFMTFAVIAVPVLLVLYVLVSLALRRRDGWPMLFRCISIGIVTLLCQGLAEWILGYDLRATARSAMATDLRGLGGITGYDSFESWAQLSIGNLAALLIGSGVAVTALALLVLVVALSHVIRRHRARQRRRERFAVALGATLLLIAGSTLFTMETERVWLFLTPPILVIAAQMVRGRLLPWIAVTLLLVQAFWIELNFRTWW